MTPAPTVAATLAEDRARVRARLAETRRTHRRWLVYRNATDALPADVAVVKKVTTCKTK